ncbi:MULTISPECIES: ester cyclase [unclassified Arthrobacter]|uniref:ester cyclase n=1 Tax=unclassified Arthrobacter TaxID=235627 RepID=UPI0028831B42|nr:MULTISPECIES: ester cyclase [unclassified Arthrobacter]
MTSMLERVTQAWTKAWGEGETEAFERLVSSDYTRQSKTGSEDLAHVVRQIEESHLAFSDFHVTVLRAIEDDNLVAIHWETVGKHTGEFMGVPPTGRAVTVRGASFISHRDGLITSEDVVWDPREMLSSMSIWHLGDQRSQRRKAGNLAD